MSSRSPTKQSPNSEVAVVGELWKATLLSEALEKLGVQTTLVPTRSPAKAIPIYEGTGDCYERARRLFGDDISRELWQLSRQNIRRAKAYFTENKIPYAEGELFRAPANPVEEGWLRESVRWCPYLSYDAVAGGLREPAMTFDTRDFGPTKNVAPEVSLTRESEFSYRLGEKVFSSVVFVSEEDVWQLMPHWRDKLIAVTLSSFVFPAVGRPQAAVGLFNGGADFCVVHPEGWQLGSYRNLYLDKAVGISDVPDPVTLTSIKKFFSGLGYIGDTWDPLTTQISIDAITCDGLPIVGSLAELPGVFLLVGFGGRAPNFIFEIAFQVACQIAGGASAETGDGVNSRFSSRRFL